MLDIYTHILPDAFAREMDRVSPGLGNIAARICQRSRQPTA